MHIEKSKLRVFPMLIINIYSIHMSIFTYCPSIFRCFVICFLFTFIMHPIGTPMRADIIKSSLQIYTELHHSKHYSSSIPVAFCISTHFNHMSSNQKLIWVCGDTQKSNLFIGAKQVRCMFDQVDVLPFKDFRLNFDVFAYLSWIYDYYYQIDIQWKKPHVTIS